MLKKLLNQAVVRLRLEALEPLLVKSGTAVVNGADMAFVRTNRGGNPEPFLPGSSLKGVLRSHAEKVARTLQDGSVCGVFDKAEIKGCSWVDSRDHYASSCPACRLFGSNHWKGRFGIGDALLTEQHRGVEPELRDGIGIDRVSGGVAGGAKFDLEVLPAGVEFETELDITNFELWQLGWMAYVLRDLQEGRIRVGSGTSRGLGRIKGHIDHLEIQYVGEPDLLTDSIPGIGALSSDAERSTYQFAEDDQVDLPEGFTFERPPGSLRSRIAATDAEAQQTLLAALAPAWDRYIATRPSLA